MTASEALDWRVRHAVYAGTVERGLPPTYAETAAALGLPADEVRVAYHRLHERHALFLEPGGDAVLMAHPFSGVPTGFRVTVAGRRYWANCAWDMLGIPAALHADAEIEAACAEDGQPVRLTVEDGRVRGEGGAVHFPLPFREWYDDLVET